MENKIKKIGALVCALIVAVSTFVTMPYYATEDNSGSYKYALLANEDEIIYKGEVGEFAFPSQYGSEFTNYVLIRVRDGSFHMILTNSDSVNMICEEKSYNKEMHYRYSLSVDSAYCRSTDGGKTWTSLTRPSGGSSSLLEICVVNPNTFWLYNEPNYIVESSVPILFDDYELRLGGLMESYKPELGYLQNVTTRTTWLSDDSGSMKEDTTRFVVKYDTVSTTGVDLTTGEYVVRLFVQKAYFRNQFNNGINDSYDWGDDIVYDNFFPLVYYAEFDASQGKLTYDLSAIVSAVSECENRYSSSQMVLKMIHEGVITYYQIYNTNTGECGGYVQLLESGMNGTYKATTYDYNLNVDDGSGSNGGYVDKDYNHSMGGGTTYEDAELNAERNESLLNGGSMDDIEGAINSFTSTLGVVPKAIGSVFSFLPSWCLNLLGVAFGLVAVLIVYKLLRG